MATDEPPSVDVSERRAALVAEREQALAKRAGELAVRERWNAICTSAPS